MDKLPTEHGKLLMAAEHARFVIIGTVECVDKLFGPAGAAVAAGRGPIARRQCRLGARLSPVPGHGANDALPRAAGHVVHRPSHAGD